VETCIECSAKQIQNIQEVFLFAQKAVLYPTAVLYDAASGKLKNDAVLALRRIFKICDRDRDGMLSDAELNHFQKKCFGMGLSESELLGVKEVVTEATGNEGVHEDKLTAIGFLYLHHLFILKGRLETTWTVLRKFGYGDDLKLRPDFLQPVFPVGHGLAVELNASGVKFFTDLFLSHDRDNDGALSPYEVQDLFSVSPGHAWGEHLNSSITVTNSGHITLDAWLAHWYATTLVDHLVTLKYLAYLGYEDDTREALVKVRRQNERAGVNASRNVFICFVLGSPACGKSSLLRAVAHAQFQNVHMPTRHINFASMRVGGKYLVLQEIPNIIEGMILREEEKMRECDVAIMLYDVSDASSFEYAAELHKKIGFTNPGITCLFYGTKSDSPAAEQDLDPNDYTRSVALPAPVEISARQGFSPDVFLPIIERVQNAGARASAVRASSQVRVSTRPSESSSFPKVAVVFAVVAVAAGAWYFVRSKK
jgi:Ras family protein T1